MRLRVFDTSLNFEKKKINQLLLYDIKVGQSAKQVNRLCLPEEV